LARVSTLAVSALGLDRPGIIAGVAERLAAHGANVTDSRMAILRGHFAMTLIVTAPAEADVEALAADLRAAGEALELEVLVVREVVEAGERPLSEPSCMVVVHGADHPGILAAVTRTLADAGVNVCGLQTRVVDEDIGDPTYLSAMEVATPEGIGDDDLRARLEAVADAENVKITVRRLDVEIL
jgi:glycine cleavage system transcriptional repressor